jgi:O-acetyl-ADP-ribose deacetylase (regulator of RNase III)
MFELEYRSLVVAATGLGEEKVDKEPTQAIRRRLRDFLTASNHDLPSEMVENIETLLHYELSQQQLVEVSSMSKYGPDKKLALTEIGQDISVLAVDAVVNPANSQLLGCFQPTHVCLDNILHAKAGPKLRAFMRSLVGQSANVPNGCCHISPGFCLPAKYILHTVGPALPPSSRPTPKQAQELGSCYKSCLDSAVENKCRTVAVCCISTGIFGYPQEDAAEVAIRSCNEWLRIASNAEQVDAIVFDCFTSRDHAIYKRRLQAADRLECGECSSEHMLSPA